MSELWVHKGFSQTSASLALRRSHGPPDGVVPGRREPVKPEPQWSFRRFFTEDSADDDLMPVPGAKNCKPGEQAGATGDKGEIQGKRRSAKLPI
jgi:hypothetical protein